MHKLNHPEFPDSSHLPRSSQMKIYVKNVAGLELESRCTDKELIVHLQAQDRGITTGTKILVSYEGGDRYLDIEAIDRVRTLPLIIFEKPSLAPPPLSLAVWRHSSPFAFLSFARGSLPHE